MLRRKFELYNFNLDEKKITVQFALFNFIDFKNKHFHVRLNDYEVPYSFEKITKDIIEIKIDIKYVTKDNNNFCFYYKAKKLWVVMDKDLQSNFELSSSIYIMKVNKSLMLNKYKTDYELLETFKDVSVHQLDEDYIQFYTDIGLDTIVFLNRTSQIEIPVKGNKIRLSDIQHSTREQQYKVYLTFNNEMYKPHFIQTYNTYYLLMNFEWSGNKLSVLTNKLSTPYLNIISILNETSISISTKIVQDAVNDNHQFITLAVIDSDLTNLKYLPTNILNERVHSQLLVDAFDTLLEKKLVAVFYNKVTKKYNLCLLQSKKTGEFIGYYYFKEEIYQLKVSNKHGLTITSRKPKFKMGVNSLTEQTLNIYFQPDMVYERFQYYLTFEERVSKSSYHVLIDRGEQEIDIPYSEIEKLKTISKNIVDVYISIYDNQKIIRKEKIKFKKGVYKKDNYLTLKTEKFDSKRVYYMFTLTPFKNIKIETFEVTDEQYQILEGSKKDNKVWLIGERTDTAQDNGVHFFNWLQENTSIEAYYVINSDSKDYDRIKQLKNVVIFGTLQHYEVAAKANVLISTHDLENILPYKTARGFWEYEKSIRVFLQHGVLGRKNVEYHKYHYDLPFHLFNVSSKSEKYDIVVDQLGYQSKDVAITGLPRFDNLPLIPNKKIKKILIMPTWRDWLNSDYAFNNSEYMKQYLDLINDKKLEYLLNQYDIEINFYPHYRAQDFFRYYLANATKRIQYIELGEKTVQELLIEHDLLITDYSSVSFDFSYMKKPVIFFHFDIERFFRKGILRPVEDTFIGEVVYNKTELINNIERMIKSNTIEQDTNLASLFDYVDHKNNERVYMAILDKLNEL